MNFKRNKLYYANRKIGYVRMHLQHMKKEICSYCELKGNGSPGCSLLLLKLAKLPVPKGGYSCTKLLREGESQRLLVPKRSKL